MGVETVLIASAAVGAAGGIYGGFEQKKAADAQADIYDEQGRAVQRAADFEIAQTANEFDRVLGEQKLSIAASGRELSGSPLEILDKTLRDKETEISNIRYNASRNISKLVFVT